MTIYSQAKQFVDMGISVFPIAYRGKNPLVQHWEPYKETLPTDADLRAWFPTNLRNYAICLGWQRLAVLDFDDMQTWYEWNHWRLECKSHPLDNAYAVKTSRGVHLYFLLLDDRDNVRIPKREEIEINEIEKSNGVPRNLWTRLPAIDFKTHGYAIGPGSTHPSGHIYHALSPMYFPIIENLSEIVPAEMLENAKWASENYGILVPTGENMQKEPVRDLWDLVDNPTPTTGALSPLETIKATWRIEQFFPGVKPTGKFMRVICPFHDDKEPSAWVNLEKQLFGCHSCNMKPMSVIGFYAAMYTGGDIKQAMEKMR